MRRYDIGIAAVLALISSQIGDCQTKPHYPSAMQISAALDETATVLSDFQNITAKIDSKTLAHWKATNDQDAEGTLRDLAGMRAVVGDVQKEIVKMQGVLSASVGSDNLSAPDLFRVYAVLRQSTDWCFTMSVKADKFGGDIELAESFWNLGGREEAPAKTFEAMMFDYLAAQDSEVIECRLGHRENGRRPTH